MQTFLTLKLNQYSKSGSTFSLSNLVEASSNCLQFGNGLYLCSPVWPAQALLEHLVLPQELSH